MHPRWPQIATERPLNFKAVWSAAKTGTTSSARGVISALTVPWVGFHLYHSLAFFILALENAFNVYIAPSRDPLVRLDRLVRESL